ncbi:MAG: cytochrome c biogenesis protein CcsA [Acidobacteria bacterium]|nr:cytochrome c biogenesis protein CcsA [Acidobacteriota bacterium]
MPTSKRLYGNHLAILAPLAAGVLVVGLVLAFFQAPIEADQGFSQKIIYIHVPLAITTLLGFVWGGICAVQYLRSGNPRDDLRSYTAIHQSLIFCIGALITGSIWAKASWGAWWVWEEPTLVSFLIVFLLYCTYQPLRFSIEDPERQARYAAVFAVVAGAFIPLNFIAVRLADPLIHPRVLGTADGGLTAGMRPAFYLCTIGALLLFATLCKYEMASKHTRAQLRALRRRFGQDAPSRPARTSAPEVPAR